MGAEADAASSSRLWRGGEEEKASGESREEAEAVAVEADPWERLRLRDDGWVVTSSSSRYTTTGTLEDAIAGEGGRRGLLLKSLAG
jgi:hypothetical protein